MIFLEETDCVFQHGWKLDVLANTGLWDFFFNGGVLRVFYIGFLAKTNCVQSTPCLVEDM